MHILRIIILFYSFFRSFQSSSVSNSGFSARGKSTQGMKNISANPIPTSDEKTKKVIFGIRELGKRYLKLKSYHDASQCYLALLQLHEGLPGEDISSCRRRFGLTLAECHIRLGNTEEAIARFSDVIDESPVFLGDEVELGTESSENDLDLLMASVGKALHMRALAFKSIGLSKFAYLDALLASDYNPFDKQIFELIDELKFEEDIDKEGEENARMEQQIFVENLQENFPRPILTSKQIQVVSRPKKIARKVYPADGQMPAAAGGIGALGGGLGSLLGAMGGAGGISSLLPMLGKMGGLSPESIQNVSEIISALRLVFSQCFEMYKFLSKNSSIILSTFATLFLLYIFVSK